MKPVILAAAGVIALAGGAVAGAMLGGNGEPQADMAAAMEHKANHPAKPMHFEYVKFNSQFVVPLQSEGRVTALLVANLLLEVPEGGTEAAILREPRIRDEFLKILFNMAAEGAFTEDLFAPQIQTELRGRLLTAARGILGDQVNAVLISDFLKQDR
jgi:flagellar FliL protein